MRFGQVVAMFEPVRSVDFPPAWPSGPGWWPVPRREVGQDDVVNFAQLIGGLRDRRPAYVLDDRYLTLVAFIDGYDRAHTPATRPLTGFADWLADRLTGGSSALHWAAQIAAIQDGKTLQKLDSEEEQIACADALNLIEEFLRRGHPR